MRRKKHRIWLGFTVLLLAVLALVASGSAVEAQPVKPLLDIVFIIDESGSMGEDIADIKAKVNYIATQLEASTDPQYALVGFGADSGHWGVGEGHPHTHTDFTNKAGFSSALAGMIASGYNEPGVWATSYAMNNISGYRTGSGVCAVLITDEDSDPPNDLAAANSALDNKDAVWFGIIDPYGSGIVGNIPTVYGPNIGSMSEHTGGALFNIIAFRIDPEPVLEALLQDCIIAITQGVVLTPGTDTNFDGEEHTVTATVKDNFNNPIPNKIVTFNVTAGPNVGTTGSGTTDVNGETTFTYTGTGGAGTDTIEASFIDDEGVLQTSRPVEKIWQLPPEADVEIVSMELVDPPSEIDVSVPIEVTLSKVVTNNGPALIVDALVTKTAVAPPGCDISPTSESEPVLGLAFEEQREIIETFTIHCSEPSFHSFEFTNVIEVTTEGVIDPNLSNNQANTSLSVVSIAYADVGITEWAVPLPYGYLDGLLEFGAGDLLISEEGITINTVKTIHNWGPWGPVDVVGATTVDAPGIDVDGPDGFTVDDLGVSVSVDVDEDFMIYCYEPSQHTITLINEITDVDPDEIHVVDTNPDNDWIERTVEVVCVIPVPVDIKPTSCRNPFNVGQKGVTPIAILGTADFDVTEIDPASVFLEGIAPLRWSLEDVATPFEPYVGKVDAFDCTEEGPDGYMDLTLKYNSQELAAALGQVSDGDVLVLHLTGILKEEFGSHVFYGEDVIVILMK